MPDTIDRLIREDSATGALILSGSRCRRCDEVLFPAIRDCPVCLEPDVMEDFQLIGHGTLRDYVVAERGPEGFEVPYVQAWVKLDDGPIVFSIVETPDPRRFDRKLGSPVTMVGRPFGSGESAFQGWKCVPDEDGGPGDG